MILILPNFVPEGPKSAMAQVMAWHHAGDKLLLEFMMIWLNDANV